METTLISKAKERIKFFESYSDKPYQCPEKKWTIGYGYNYQDNGLPSGLPTAMCTELFSHGFTRELAEYLVDREANKALSAAMQFKWFEKLSFNRQIVIVDMLYQLGTTRFVGFKKFIAALSAGNWTEAAKEMKDSDWYRQSGRRGRSNVDQMTSDKWVMYEK